MATETYPHCQSCGGDSDNLSPHGYCPHCQAIEDSPAFEPLTGASALRDAAAADRVYQAQDDRWERAGDPDDYPAQGEAR